MIPSKRRWLNEHRALPQRPTLARKGEPKGECPERPTKLKRYRVLCAVTRAEWYEIDAPDEAIALR